MPHLTLLYKNGEHGSGLGGRNIRIVRGHLTNLHPWTAHFLAFLETQGILPPQDPETGLRIPAMPSSMSPPEGEHQESEEREEVDIDADGRIL